MIGLKSLSEADSMHGGKAIGLRRLIEKGLRVPDGIALDRDTVKGLNNGNVELVAQLESWLKSINGQLAVRSSAANEDGVEHSFAGMYESVLMVDPSLDIVLKNLRHVSTSGRSERV